MKGSPSTSLARSDQDFITPETVKKYLVTFGLATDLTPQETEQFIQIATAFQLNPFKREIFAVPYGFGESRKLSLIVGYETYIKRAERSGKLDGWKAWTEGEGENAKAIVEIFRKDWSHSFQHEVFFPEVVQRKKDGSPTSFWAKQPRFQLRKVAISQGFRLAFSDELGGMPYEASELGEESLIPAEPASMPVQHSSPFPLQSSQPRPARTTPRPLSPPQAKLAPPAPPSAAPMPLPSLRTNIEALLKTHPRAFPAAHATWIRQELSKNPNDRRLEEIHEHMQSVLNEAGLAQPEAELEEVPIF